jgi:hypothetical protein
MSDWITANWIWILLAIGAGWFVLRRGGMGCGMGGHRSHVGARPAMKEPELGAESPNIDRDEDVKEPAAAAPGPHRHRGCC